MENIQYEAILGIMSEINKKLDTIQVNSKIKDNQPVIQSVSKETIAVKYANVMGKYMEIRHKQQTKHHARILQEV
ncbi:hypothetical protein FACS1894181_18230 [Bacteroidia bacterium]|nr:hypothetical protein FACS1894181_18230 [Bacteroidia bacterium]